MKIEKIYVMGKGNAGVFPSGVRKHVDRKAIKKERRGRVVARPRRGIDSATLPVTSRSLEGELHKVLKRGALQFDHVLTSSLST